MTRPASIWGGSFGVDLGQVRPLGVSFDENLGRVGASLASAEDTTFVRELVTRGAVAEAIHDAQVRHLIPVSRLSLAYLLRRAFWQGRSEVRRNDAWSGLAKEWSRNRGSEGGLPGSALAGLYTVSVALGMCHEACLRAVRHARAREGR